MCRSLFLVTLRQRINPRGFFRLSSVVDERRNAAWLRLGAHRSGRGKARRQRLHSGVCFLGGAKPVAASMPCAKGRMAHNLRLASWEAGTPASFEAYSVGTYPHGWRLFLMLFSMLRHFLNPWSGYPWLRTANSWYILVNTVVFFPTALRCRTRTLVSCSRDYCYLLTPEQKSGNARDARAQARDA